MENYFTVNINNIWNNLIDYFWYLKENPLRLIILILDLTIVTSYLESGSTFSRKYGSFASVVTLSIALVSFS